MPVVERGRPDCAGAALVGGTPPTLAAFGRSIRVRQLRLVDHLSLALSARENSPDGRTLRGGYIHASAAAI